MKADAPWALYFALLAALLLAFAWFLGAWGWLLAWPALAFAWVAWAYAGNRHNLFGKHEDGRLSLLPVAVGLPFIGLSWLSLRLAELGREAPWNQVAPGIFVGRRPGRGEWPDVEVVVDLTAEFPSVARPPGVALLCLPTLDTRAPDADALQSVIAAIGDRSVLFHCALGHGRSATVAGLLLLERRDAESADQALAKLKAARPGIGLRAGQRRMLESWVVSQVK